LRAWALAYRPPAAAYPHAELRADPRPSPGQVPADGERSLPGLRTALAGPGPAPPEHLPVGNGRRGPASLPAGQHGDRADDRHRRPPDARLQLAEPGRLPGHRRAGFGALPAAVREPPLRHPDRRRGGPAGAGDRRPGRPDGTPALRRRRPALRHAAGDGGPLPRDTSLRSEEHTSELQSRANLVCRLLLEKTRLQTYQQRCHSSAYPRSTS